MEPEFITYQKFNDAALANGLAELLDEHNIQYYIQEETSGFDPSLVMSNAPVDYAVKIKSEDFQSVNELQKENEGKNIEGIEKDYYLFSFTEEELMEVLTKADQWSTFDVVLARKILTERGKNISDADLAAIDEKRIEELKEPETGQSTWIILGYILAVMGGVLGLFIGWHLKTHKKTLPDGEKVYAYTRQDRRHGKVIFYLAIAGTIAGVIYKIWPAFKSDY
jgi:hypothetical protein